MSARGGQTKAMRVPRRDLAAGVHDVEHEQVREMAVPSYTHPNPFIRWLFWKRLDVAVALAGPTAGCRILDFGAGSGILLPTHHRDASRVVAVDIELRPIRSLVAARGLPTELVDASRFMTWSEDELGGFDIVYALDVLEHVEQAQLAPTITRLLALLAPAGRLVVSGPTESRMYRLGRALAGFRHVEYHDRNISDIDALIREGARREAWRRVPPWPLPVAFWLGRYVPR